MWHSGIFVWKAKDVVNAFRIYIPDIIYIFACGLIKVHTPRETVAIKHIYKHCQIISIDYAILEKVKNVFVVPADFDWRDLRIWNSAWDNFGKDEAKNAVAGENTLMVDANGCIVHSSDKKFVLVGGLDDFIVVNTQDILLICKKENEQQIKEYLLKVKEKKGELYL